MSSRETSPEIASLAAKILGTADDELLERVCNSAPEIVRTLKSLAACALGQREKEEEKDKRWEGWPEWLRVNSDADTITIYGVCYARSFFADLGREGPAVGTLLRIAARGGDGTIMLQKVGEVALAGPIEKTWLNGVTLLSGEREPPPLPDYPERKE